MRVDTKVLNAIKAEAKATGMGYQTIINMKLSKYTGVALAVPPKKAERPKLAAKPLIVKVAAKRLAVKTVKAKKVKAATKTKRGPYKKKTK
jgi:hypothetical protein